MYDEVKRVDQKIKISAKEFIELSGSNEAPSTISKKIKKLTSLMQSLD